MASKHGLASMSLRCRRLIPLIATGLGISVHPGTTSATVTGVCWPVLAAGPLLSVRARCLASERSTPELAHTHTTHTHEDAPCNPHPTRRCGTCSTASHLLGAVQTRIHHIHEVRGRCGGGAGRRSARSPPRAEWMDHCNLVSVRYLISCRTARTPFSVARRLPPPPPTAAAAARHSLAIGCGQVEWGSFAELCCDRPRRRPNRAACSR